MARSERKRKPSMTQLTSEFLGNRPQNQYSVITRGLPCPTWVPPSIFWTVCWGQASGLQKSLLFGPSASVAVRPVVEPHAHTDWKLCCTHVTHEKHLWLTLENHRKRRPGHLKQRFGTHPFSCAAWLVHSQDGVPSDPGRAAALLRRKELEGSLKPATDPSFKELLTALMKNYSHQTQKLTIHPWLAALMFPGKRNNKLGRFNSHGTYLWSFLQ